MFRTYAPNSVAVYSYNKEYKNEYILKMEGEEFSLVRQAIFFNPDDLLGINKSNFGYKKQLFSKVKNYLAIMDSLQIGNISSEFYDKGIDMKIYMKSGYVMLYVSNKKHVINPEWLKYVNSMRMLDSNWYYSPRDY